MRIGFDVSQTAEEKAGCGFFADQLVRALAEVDADNSYLLYPTFYGYRHSRYSQATGIDRPNFKTMLTDWSFSEVCRWWDIPQDRTAALGNPDIIHANNYSCPKQVAAKKVFTVYDLAVMEVPCYTTEENRLVCFQGLFEAAIYADFLIMISEATRKAFFRHFPHYPEERTRVVYLGTRPTISRLAQERRRRILSRLGVSAEGFWLGVGTVEPRKNYRMLIEAYRELLKQDCEQRPLYIAGGKGWMESDIGQYVRDSGLDGKIRFLGYVSDEELSALYSSCFAFIYPSFYEGFGLPVLEAMSCGAAVICSNTTSMPEVAGKAALLIEPSSRESLVSAMMELNKNEELVFQMRRDSLEQAGKFSWERAARETLEVYEKLYEAVAGHR